VRSRSPEYRDLVSGPLDPLVHPTPMEPARFYLLIRRLARWVVTHLFRVTVTGLENIPQPPYIIAANHQAWFDPAFIIPFFPERPLIYTMARRETVFNRAWKRRLLPLIGVFPISPNKGELDEQGLRTVYQVLDRGGALLIFPEGRYSRGRALRPLKNGVGYFALQAGVPVSPVAVAAEVPVIELNADADEETLSDAISGVEFVVFCAVTASPARRLRYRRQPPTALQRVVDAARKARVRRLVHVSTADVYGSDHFERITEKSELKPAHAYERTK